VRSREPKSHDSTKTHQPVMWKVRSAKSVVSPGNSAVEKPTKEMGLLQTSFQFRRAVWGLATAGLGDPIHREGRGRGDWVKEVGPKNDPAGRTRLTESAQPAPRRKEKGLLWRGQPA